MQRIALVPVFQRNVKMHRQSPPQPKDSMSRQPRRRGNGDGVNDQHQYRVLREGLHESLLTMALRSLS